jgi:hypothetical protein
VVAAFCDTLETVTARRFMPARPRYPAGMPYVYRATDRAGSWPMLTSEPRHPGPSCPVRGELVAEADEEAAAWDAFERLAGEMGYPKEGA